jgi:hypothetical protein
MATLRAPMPAVISAIAELLLRLFGPSAWEALALTKLPSSSASELLKKPWEQPDSAYDTCRIIPRWTSMT